MNMEHNKILAAVLVAGLTAYTCGMIARGAVHSEKLEKNVYDIEVPEAAAAGGAPAATGPEPIEGLMASADLGAGEKLSKVCASCHTFGAGEPHKVGPNLHGIVGKAKAAVGGYTYSEALAAAGGKWDVDALNHFLWKPQKMVPGSKMTFAGLKKAEDRAALIKWLETQK